MITRFYLPLLSTNVKHPKFGCHVTSLCQGLRRSAGSGGEDPENQVVRQGDNPNIQHVLLDRVIIPSSSNQSEPMGDNPLGQFL